MTSRFENPKHKQTWMRPARVTIAGLAALIAAGEPAGATSARSKHSVESIGSRTAGEPIMAIVSLRNQRITVYDSNGWILRAPVSSGQKGRETPAGIFSVIEKKAEHYSNLYDDAYMPHMQRITWSGIALHGGLLPGYPASHGCVRMPFDFAARLFDVTRLGMRVIVAPERCGARRDRPSGSVPVEAGCRRLRRRPCCRGGGGGQEGGSGETRRRDGLPRGRAGDDAGARGRKSEAQSRGAIGSRRDCSWLAQSRPRQRSRPRRPRRRQSPGSPSCRRNGPPPRLSCSRNSMLSRLRVKPSSPQRPRGSRQPRRRARWHASSSRYRFSLAARPSAFMSGGPFSPSWRVRSRSWMPIVRWARMSSPPWGGSTATPTCDGASSHWTADVRTTAW